MIIPNAERSEIDLRKLCDYCLNPTHDEGKHKARLFATALGMTKDHANELRDALLQAVKAYEAKLGRRDKYTATSKSHLMTSFRREPESRRY